MTCAGSSFHVLLADSTAQTQSCLSLGVLLCVQLNVCRSLLLVFNFIVI